MAKVRRLCAVRFEIGEDALQNRKCACGFRDFREAKQVLSDDSPVKELVDEYSHVFAICLGCMKLHYLQ